MYIKANPGTRRIMVRTLNGDRLESPITAVFADNGVARVRDGVGELLADLFPAITVMSHEEDAPEEGEVTEEDTEEDA